MASTNDPTVPLPTAVDSDDDDDDDDDNVASSLLTSQPPAATPPPAQPTVAPAPVPPAETSVGTPPVSAPPGPAGSGNPSISTSLPPSSATRLAENFPSGSTTGPDPTGAAGNSNSNSNNSGNGLSTGAAAGVGIGVALIVCLAAFGVWFFLRRRKGRQITTRSTSSHSSDEEHAAKLPKPEVYAYHAGAPVEMSGDEKPRRWSELESPTYVAEAGDGQVFRAELPGSVVPVATAAKGRDERLFADAPIDEVEEPGDAQERTMDKKRDERLFSDPPIDDGTDRLLAEPIPNYSEKKG